MISNNLIITAMKMLGKNLRLIVLFGLCLLSNAMLAQNKPDLGEIAPAGALTIAPISPVGYTQPAVPKLNFTRVWNPQIPITDANNVDESTSVNDNLQATSYIDGFGNSLQSISRYAVTPTHHGISFQDTRVLKGGKYSFLPYAIADNSLGSINNGDGFRYDVFTEQRNYYNAHFPNEGHTAFSVSSFVVTNGKRKAYNFKPGKSQVGQLRGTTTQNELVGTTTIRRWVYTGINSLPVSPGAYGPNQLVSETKEGQHGRKVISYYDDRSRLVAKKVLANQATSSYQTSYFVYDRYDRLCYSISPKATEKINANAWVMTQNIADNLCGYKTYDALGREIAVSSPDKDGKEVLVYDKSKRAVLVQDPNLKDKNQWMFTVHDAMGRTAFTGIISSTEDRDYWQYILDRTGTAPSTLPSAIDLSDPNQIYTYLINGVNLVQNGGSYPASISNTEILSYNYYDHYNHSEISGYSFSTAFISHLYADVYSNTYGTVPIQSTFPTQGSLVATRTKILDPNGVSSFSGWVTNVFFFDEYGRTIQSIQSLEQDVAGNAKTIYKDVNTSMYDFGGRVLRSISEHNKTIYPDINNPSSATSSTHWTTDKHEYQARTFKLLKVSQKIDNQNWEIINELTYDSQTGALIEKNMGQVEIQRYENNIRGQLTGINKSYAETGVSMPNTTFGESIKYDHGFNEKRYDGNISGITWCTPSVKPRSYGYTYSTNGQLLHADFDQFDGTTNTNPADWDDAQVDFTVSELNYDANGNILSVHRMGTDQSGIQTWDELQLAYTNGDVSNRLEEVTDNANFGNPGSVEQEFQDHNPGGQDYSYDKNGNTTSDANKQVETTFNYLDKPDKLQFNNGTTIDYIYTADGSKLEEITTQNAVPMARAFIGGYEYKDKDLSLKYHAEGRARYAAGANNQAGTFNYDYLVKDHLDNVRTVVTSQLMPFYDYLATHEVAYAQVEEAVFENIDGRRGVRPGTGPSNGRAARLDGDDPATRVGTSLLLHVMAGDKVNISADAYYDGSSTPTGTTSGEDMLEQIINTLLSNASQEPQGEGPSNAEIVNNTFNYSNYIGGYDAIKNQLTDPTKPRAYLNYVVFDENYKIVPDQCGAVQVNTADNWHTLQTNGDLVIKQGGYIAIYISNESTGMVSWFDDLDIRFYRGALLEENHYYPYGMAVRISQDLNIKPTNQQLYQTKELTQTENLNLYDFHARQYDPLLGRFASVDPAGQFASGYVGMANNPTSFVDPTGMVAVQDYKSQATWSINRSNQSERQNAWNNVYVSSEPMLAAEVAIASVFPTVDVFADMAAADAEHTDYVNGLKMEEHNAQLRSEIEEMLDEEDSDVHLPKDISSMDLEALKEKLEEMADEEPEDVTEGTTHLYEANFVEANEYEDLESFVVFDYSVDKSSIDPEILSTLKDVKWVQTIVTDFPANGSFPNQPFVDNDGGGVFYNSMEYTDNEIDRTFSNANYEDVGNFKFSDTPARPADRNFSWRAELSLVGIRKNNSMIRLQTTSYGWSFSTTMGNQRYKQINVTTPSQFHMNVINNPNRYQR